MKIVDDIVKNAHVLTLPMVVRFRGISQRETLVFEGPRGWGEFNPFPEYSDDESVLWLESALEAAYGEFVGFQRDTVEVNVTVPAVAPSDIPKLLSRYSFGPGPTAKIKVADGLVADGLKEKSQDSRASGMVFEEALKQDVERVDAVIRYVEKTSGTAVKLRVDSNGAWTYEQAVVALETLKELAEKRNIVFEYVEQPVSDIEDMIRLKKYFAHSGVFLAVDENIRRGFVHDGGTERGVVASQVSRLRQAADIMIIKNAPSGGNFRAMKFVKLIGLPAVVSSALDTGIGLYAAARLAAGLEELEHACGLNTDVLFREEIAPWGSGVTGGILDVPACGPIPDRSILKKYQADSAREKWWLERLRKVFDYRMQEVVHHG